MSDLAKCFVITLVVFLVLDAIWLGVIAPRFYRAQIGFLMADRPRWLAAGVFYLIFVAGLVFFVVSPGVREGLLGKAALRGALFGLVTYATYDLTNLATVKGWPLLVTVVDLGWGTVLSATTALLSVWLGANWVR
jgi:uncharacterized membrane protein